MSSAAYVYIVTFMTGMRKFLKKILRDVVCVYRVRYAVEISRIYFALSAVVKQQRSRWKRKILEPSRARSVQRYSAALKFEFGALWKPTGTRITIYDGGSLSAATGCGAAAVNRFNIIIYVLKRTSFSRSNAAEPHSSKHTRGVPI